jgi:hypothetical protein
MFDVEVMRDVARITARWWWPTVVIGLVLSAMLAWAMPRWYLPVGVLMAVVMALHDRRLGFVGLGATPLEAVSWVVFWPLHATIWAVVFVVVLCLRRRVRPRGIVGTRQEGIRPPSDVVH